MGWIGGYKVEFPVIGHTLEERVIKKSRAIRLVDPEPPEYLGWDSEAGLDLISGPNRFRWPWSLGL